MQWLSDLEIPRPYGIFLTVTILISISFLPLKIRELVCVLYVSNCAFVLLRLGIREFLNVVPVVLKELSIDY